MYLASWQIYNRSRNHHTKALCPDSSGIPVYNHWELSQKIDKGSTNTLINQIFEAVEDLIEGKMICGAGGGGFLQVVLKKSVSHQQVHERLKNVFQDGDIDVWDCRLI